MKIAGHLIVIDYLTLVNLILDGNRRGYNRQLDLGELDLDPEGWNVISSLMLHEQMGGVKQMPDNWQHRCSVLMKVEGNQLPVVGQLDVNINVWNRLLDSIEVDEDGNRKVSATDSGRW